MTNAKQSYHVTLNDYLLVFSTDLSIFGKQLEI